jgi:hypothetical protein
VDERARWILSSDTVSAAVIAERLRHATGVDIVRQSPSRVVVRADEAALRQYVEKTLPDVLVEPDVRYKHA